MTDNNLPFDNSLPQRVIDTTRDLYAPPSGDSYWATLESKVMARIATPIRTWQVLGAWARGGLIAAATILVIVTLFLAQSNRQNDWATYDDVMHPSADPLPIPSGVLTEWDGLEARGETFRDVISR